MTTETTETEPRVAPWRWPARWIKDEPFWRDIASRTFSGIFVAFVVYWGAVIMGYVKTPENMHIAYRVTLTFITIAIAVWWTSKFPSRKFRSCSYRGSLTSHVSPRTR